MGFAAKEPGQAASRFHLETSPGIAEIGVSFPAIFFPAWRGRVFVGNTEFRACSLSVRAGIGLSVGVVSLVGSGFGAAIFVEARFAKHWV